MKELIIDRLGSNQRLDKYLAKYLSMIDEKDNVLKTFTDYSEETNIQFINLKMTENHPWIDMSIKDIVLLGSVDIRRFIKKLIESNYRDLEVLSYGELTENVSINILKTI